MKNKDENRRTGDLESGWIQTFSGGKFWPLDPRPEDVSMEDVAHSLSLMCRFLGHCKGFYSIAQHSVLVSDLVPPEDALWGLLHDASEAYLADVPSTIKPLLTNYKDIETKVELCIAERFNLPWPRPPSIKKADRILLATEARDLMAHEPVGWNLKEEPATITILPQSPEKAELMFLRRLVELSGFN